MFSVEEQSPLKILQKAGWFSVSVEDGVTVFRFKNGPKRAMPILPRLLAGKTQNLKMETFLESRAKVGKEQYVNLLGVRNCGNPTDMFFADIELIEYESDNNAVHSDG